jgi:uncharacterized protein (TIGR00297 family)
VVAVKSRAIDVSGAASGAVISFVAFLAGGIYWFVLIVAFFAVSSAFTRYRYEYKKRIGSAQEKSGTRSWPNSVANGGIAAIAAVLEINLHADIFAVAYVGSLATAMADTLATEVGVLSKSQPRLITNLQRVVRAGTSGGVSPLGESTAFLSALGMGILGIFLVLPWRLNAAGFLAIVPAVLVGGFGGTTIDSVFGAKFQRASRCEICGALTEGKTHHDRAAKLVKGTKYIDNNVVNFVGALSGAVISVLVYLAISGRGF